MENGENKQYIANSYENFDRWIDNSLFVDLKVFLSKDSGSKSVNCHKFIIQRRSPSFLADLLALKIDTPNENNDSNNNIDKVVITPDLEYNEEFTKLFLRMFYVGSEAYSAIQYNLASIDKTKLITLCEKYHLHCTVAANKTEEELISVTVPEARRRTAHADIIIRIKGTDCDFMCHRLVLVHYSEYFRAMFESEMKEKSAEQLCLDISGHMEDQDKGTVFQLFLHSIYTGNDPTFPSIEIAMHSLLLAEQYFCPLFKKHCYSYLKRQLTPRSIVKFISTALKYNIYDLVEVATDYFLPNLVTIALQSDFNELPLEYIMNIEFESKNTIYHQCMESSVDPACLNAIKKLQEMIGDDSRVNIFAPNSQRETLVHLAAKSAKPTTLQYLINQGMDVNQRDANNMTPLEIVFDKDFNKKFIPIVNILMSNGAQAKPPSPSTVYKYAAYCNPVFEQHKALWPLWVKLLEQTPPVFETRPKSEISYRGDPLSEYFEHAATERNFALMKTMIERLKIEFSIAIDAFYKKSEVHGDVTFTYKEVVANFSGPAWFKVDLKGYHIGRIATNTTWVGPKHGSGYTVETDEQRAVLTFYNEERHDHFIFVCGHHSTTLVYPIFMWYLWIDQNVKEESKERMFLQEIPLDDTSVDSEVISTFTRYTCSIYVTDISEQMREQTGCTIQ